MKLRRRNSKKSWFSQQQWQSKVLAWLLLKFLCFNLFPPTSCGMQYASATLLESAVGILLVESAYCSSVQNFSYELCDEVMFCQTGTWGFCCCVKSLAVTVSHSTKEQPRGLALIVVHTNRCLPYWDVLCYILRYVSCLYLHVTCTKYQHKMLQYSQRFSCI